jgi:hypothetical protein
MDFLFHSICSRHVSQQVSCLKSVNINQNNKSFTRFFGFPNSNYRFIGLFTMVNRCIVPECFCYGNRGYFSFPKVEERRQLWLEKCGISKNVQPKRGQCVFYRHFSESDITTTKKGMSLSKCKN